MSGCGCVWVWVRVTGCATVNPFSFVHCKLFRSSVLTFPRFPFFLCHFPYCNISLHIFLPFFFYSCHPASLYSVFHQFILQDSLLLNEFAEWHLPRLRIITHLLHFILLLHISHSPSPTNDRATCFLVFYNIIHLHVTLFTANFASFIHHSRGLQSDIFFATTAPESFTMRRERVKVDRLERDPSLSPPPSPHGKEHTGERGKEEGGGCGGYRKGRKKRLKKKRRLTKGVSEGERDKRMKIRVCKERKGNQGVYK